MYILIAGVKEWSQDVNSALKSGLFLHLFGQSLYNGNLPTVKPWSRNNSFQK
jgi:hypothetical protein